ncbi:uncharacterized protein ACA1_257990 [Acanthamoeba castellanii str. Neff]|uniref:F-box domain-containing protein n=1 Tax=Acanthamoeba castellanii (strain ATCC 30010 / Neff) TaxID=1257118 RepID=L8GFS8_ACACF|nr:uncharacterized protein ACA1_257990 [Acanthamoeba castellanii str. Neff]ELR11568.1 hypothetical protein ACA1_257990 [Acanthamoeba castellanii str. Neff]
MDHLEPYDLCSVAQTCAALDRVSSADCIWRRFCDVGTPWKGKYMKWLAPRLKRFARRRQAEMQSTTPSPAERTLKVVLYGDWGPFERIERLISVETGVGKSTLHRRLTGYRYVPYQPPTTLRIPYRVQTLQIAGLPVTLHLGAKADLEERRQVTAAEGQALALELGTLWAETSSLTGRGGAAS